MRVVHEKAGSEESIVGRKGLASEATIGLCVDVDGKRKPVHFYHAATAHSSSQPTSLAPLLSPLTAHR